jgi:hypothetical protein
MSSTTKDTADPRGPHKVCERCNVGYYGERDCPYCAVVGEPHAGTDEQVEVDWLAELDQVEVNRLAARLIGEDLICSDALCDLIREAGITAEDAGLDR